VSVLDNKAIYLDERIEHFNTTLVSVLDMLMSQSAFAKKNFNTTLVSVLAISTKIFGGFSTNFNTTLVSVLVFASSSVTLVL